VRAVVVGQDGEPALTDVVEPEGPGELVRVIACGLCGSDVEKLQPQNAGLVPGHEVVARADDGRRVALVHHAPCGACERCRAGHESTCEQFAASTIRPGGFAERARADGFVELPSDWPDWRGTMIEPLACVLRAVDRVPRGRVLIVGNGFVGHLFGAVLDRRGDEVFAIDLDPRRAGRAPDGAVDAAVLCGEGGVTTALDTVRPGGTGLVFAVAGQIPAAAGYRCELTVAGSRSASPTAMSDAVALLDDLDVPEPTVLPLERFADGLELFRRRDALKLVFTP
jgi:L-iditol 2-dehydrogenase